MRRVAIFIAALLTAVLGCGVNAETVWLSPGPALPAATLVDQDGRSVRLDTVAGDRPLIVQFLYTECATICPMQTSTLRDVRTLLDSIFYEKYKTPLILSLAIQSGAPAPNALRKYARQFDILLGDAEGWLMLSGAPETIRLIRAAFDERTSIENHSGALWIGSPARARWTRIPFSSPTASQPETIAALAREAGR